MVIVVKFNIHIFKYLNKVALIYSLISITRVYLSYRLNITYYEYINLLIKLICNFQVIIFIVTQKEKKKLKNNKKIHYKI